MAWYPSAGLPPGQFVTPDPEFSAGTPGIDHALWMTDEPVPDAGQLWARLLRDHEDAGLWPLLLITMRPRAGPGRSGTVRCGDAADRFAADLAAAPGGVGLLTGRDSGIHIGLVQAADRAAALTACGFMSRRGETAEDAAVIRSWQDRFGARLCAVGFDCLALSVANPPVSQQHCLRVGAEHLAYETPEALVDGIDTPLSFEEYAARLSGASTWWFWWD